MPEVTSGQGSERLRSARIAAGPLNGLAPASRSALQALPGGERVRVCVGAEAHALLESEPFMARWQALYERCPWATAGQHPEFARCWYRVFTARARPVLVFAEREHELSGLLALYQDGDSLVHVGHQDCEYQVWSALPEEGERFLPRALAALEQRLGPIQLELDCMPPETPLRWLLTEPAAAGRCELGLGSRRVLRVSDPEYVSGYIRSKSRLRTSVNKLKRTGAVRFHRATDAAEIKRVLHAAVPLLELRKGAAYGHLPFRDEPLRLAFLLAQAEVPGLLHVTALERDGQVLAAHIATAGRRELSIAGIAHSEFESRHSPGAALILELIGLLCAEGRELLDFTPGHGEYKERFASELQEVYRLRVHATRLARERQRAQEWGRHMARAAARKLVSSVPPPVQQLCSQLGTRARALTRSAPQPKLQLQAVQLCAPYASPARASAAPEPPSAAPGAWARNAIADLLLHAGDRSAYLELLRCASGHIRAGAQMYTRTSGEVLQAVCFLLHPDGPADGHAGPAVLGCELDATGSAPMRTIWTRELAGLLRPS